MNFQEDKHIRFPHVYNVTSLPAAKFPALNDPSPISNITLPGIPSAKFRTTQGDFRVFPDDAQWRSDKWWRLRNFYQAFTTIKNLVQRQQLSKEL